MKKVMLQFLFACMAVIPAFSQKTSLPKDETLELNKVIDRINVALTEAQKIPNLPKLKNATVKLETTADKSGGGGFKIFVKASRKWTKGSGSSVTYKYEAPMTIEKSGKANEFDLVKIIKSAAMAYQTSKDIVGLEKKSFEIEVAFSIKDSGDAGIEFEIYGVGVDAGGEWERTVGHTITLEFE